MEEEGNGSARNAIRGKMVVEQNEDYSESSSAEEDEEEEYNDEEDEDCIQGDGLQNQNLRGMRASAADCGKGNAGELMEGSRAATRSSVKYVVGVVSKFDPLKRDLVKSIGFGGILEIPQINKVSRAFTVWLLSNLEPDTRTIVVDGKAVLDMVDLDVKRILGIPCGHRIVAGLEVDDARSKKEFMEKVIGAAPNEKNSLLAAGRIIAQKYSNKMTKEESDHFKAAFVVFVVGHLLAPTTKNNVGNSSFWGALKNPDEISLYNWGEYVLQQLVEAAIKVQTDIKTKNKVSNITGCSIFLQILYLDSLRIKGMERIPKVFPRIKAYDCSVLRLMMEADQANSSGGSNKRTWGTTLVRRSGIQSEPSNEGEDFAGAQKVPSMGSYDAELARFINESFNGKLNQTQLNAMKVYETRCATHFEALRCNLMKENLVLLEFLMINSDSRKNEESWKTNARATEVTNRGGAKRSIDRIETRTTRGYESADEGYVLRRKRRTTLPSRSYQLPETILSGGSIPRSSAEEQRKVTVGLNMQNIGAQSDHECAAASNRSVSRNEGVKNSQGTFEAPSFDLGIDNQEQMELVEANCQQIEGGNGIIQGPANEPATSAKTTEGQIMMQSEKQFAMLCGTPISAKKKQDGNSWSTPDERFSSSTVSPASMTKIFAGCEVAGRIILTEDGVNVNVKPFNDDITDSPVTKHQVGAYRLAKSPWFYDLNQAFCPVDVASKVFNKVMTCSLDDLERTWVAHSYPRYLEVPGRVVASSFSLKEAMGYEIYDLALRRVIQIENEMYKACNEKCWRHILESDFAVLSLADENPSGMKSIIEQFFGSCIKYKIHRCRMIVVPAQVLLDWSCYFWDFKKKCIHVIDPLYKTEDSDFYVKKHSGIVKKIGGELAKSVDMFFDSWEVNLNEWRTEYVIPALPNASSTETGILSLLSIREFDGDVFRNLTKESYEEFKMMLLAELLSIEGNQARPPFKTEMEKPMHQVVYDVED